MSNKEIDLQEEKSRWEQETLRSVLERYPERRETFTTSAGIPVRRLYLPPDGAERYLEKLGFPGEYPFTRGVQPTMYRGRFWTMRQYAGFGSAAESNERFRYLLSRGQTGLSVAFDLPTQIGYDADHPLAEGEVGRVGVSIPTLEDMTILLDGIPLDRVSVSMTINAPAAILLAMVIAVARRQGVRLDQLRGTVQNDILKEYIARGTYIFPPSPSMRLTTDLFEYCARELPRWNTISVSGYHIREAGSTAAQEIAFTLANGIAYVQRAIQAGLDVDAFADQISFFFNVHNNFMEEIAKFRAARRLWADIMRHRFRAQDPRSWRLRFHAQTAGSTLTAQQPDNNITRVALQALAAVLGGTQSLHTNSRDEALSLPTEEAARIALRTQQIVAYETGVADTVDALAGSYYLESLTDELEKLARDYLETIDDLGGMTAAIEQGYVQREIQEAAYQYQRDLEDGEATIVGVNRFTEQEEPQIDLHRADPAVEAEQKRRLARFRQQRDDETVVGLRQQLAAGAAGDQNLMPLIVACVENKVTLGEICATLREVWGEYRPAAGL
ncbi:MAG: methylmalonyl-CoA mutase family protein [Candidatus Promineifilaceae bacterium]|nr:methylmalonyl-CoA mutase family protein [Candidatus Promineifilaceae bacterium]